MKTYCSLIKEMEDLKKKIENGTKMLKWQKITKNYNNEFHNYKELEVRIQTWQQRLRILIMHDLNKLLG